MWRGLAPLQNYYTFAPIQDVTLGFSCYGTYIYWPILKQGGNAYAFYLDLSLSYIKFIDAIHYFMYMGSSDSLSCLPLYVKFNVLTDYCYCIVSVEECP